MCLMVRLDKGTMQKINQVRCNAHLYIDELQMRHCVALSLGVGENTITLPKSMWRTRSEYMRKFYNGAPQNNTSIYG